MNRKMNVVVIACLILFCLAAPESINDIMRKYVTTGITLKVCNNFFADTSPNSMRNVTLNGKPETSTWDHATYNCRGLTGVTEQCVANMYEWLETPVEGRVCISADELDKRTLVLRSVTFADVRDEVKYRFCHK